MLVVDVALDLVLMLREMNTHRLYECTHAANINYKTLVIIMHLSMTSPSSGWIGSSEDLTEYHVKNPSPAPGVLPDVNTPIHGQESIGDLT